MDSENSLGFEDSGNSETESVSTSSSTVQEQDPPAFNPPLPPLTPHTSPELANPQHPSLPVLITETPSAFDLLMSVSVRAEANKTKIEALAQEAVKELVQLATEQELFWVFNVNSGTWLLNEERYISRFGTLDASLEEIIKMLTREEPNPPNMHEDQPVEFPKEVLDEVSSIDFGAKPLQREASQDIGLVFMDPLRLVKMFMDVDQWKNIFSNIVAKATLLGDLSMGGKWNLNGALQVIRAEFQMSSPLVKTRDSFFARHCKQMAYNTWVVVDVCLESVFPNPVIRCERRPSGCLIQGMKNGYSKVTWIEHLETDHRLVHNLFRPFITSGFAFSAKLWLSTLARQCDRLATLRNDRALQGWMRSLLNLADRMMSDYYASVNGSLEKPWRSIPLRGAEDILIMASYNSDVPGAPRGVALTIATSVRLPVQPRNVFDFLRNGNARNQWDLLSYGRTTQEVERIRTGRNVENCVSVVAVKPLPNEAIIYYLQESYTNPTGLYVVYAPIDVCAMRHLLDGGDPDRVQILASGFAILPERPPAMPEGRLGGTILTLSFQIMDLGFLTTYDYLPPAAVATIYKMITETVSNIMVAVNK